MQLTMLSKAQQVILHLGAAFDAVNHHIAVPTVMVSIKDSVLNLTHTYFSNITFAITLNNHKFLVGQRSCGSPQGSLLDPFFLTQFKWCLLASLF